MNFPDFIAWTDWPPYSPDLNPMDYFVWGYLEAKVCSVRHASVQSLKAAINREWKLIPQEYLRAAADNFMKRLTKCVSLKGGVVE